jgi:hypothetical protein
MLRQEKTSVRLAVIMLISLVLSQNVGALRFNVFIYGTEQSKFMNIPLNLPVDPGNESVDLPVVNTTINMSSPPSSFSSGKEIKVVAPITGVYQSAFADFNGEFYCAYVLLESSCKHPLQKHQESGYGKYYFSKISRIIGENCSELL